MQESDSNEGFEKTMILAPQSSKGREGPPKARMLCLNDADLPDASCRVIPIAGEGFTIGRDDGNTFTLLAHGVSRKHAKVFSGGDMWGIQDLGSTNGVVVNGSRVTETWLKHGDTVEIGKIRYKYLEEGRDMPAPKANEDDGGGGEKTVIMSAPTAPVSPGAVTQKMDSVNDDARRSTPPRSTRPRMAEESGSNVFLWILGALALVLVGAMVVLFL